MFLIVGERRSGSSTLAKWLSAHPDIYIDKNYDTAYFIDEELRGSLKFSKGKIDKDLWQENHNVQDYYEKRGFHEKNRKEFGEKSADYFYWDYARLRIKKHLPNTKIIVVLRNPVNRAWSHYWNEIGKSREILDFKDALEQEQARFAESDYAKLHLSYFDRGKYSDSLTKWIDDFGLKNIHVVILERLVNDPKTELKRVYDFLELDSSKGFDYLGQRFNHNWTMIPRAFWRKTYLHVQFEKRINFIIKVISRKFYSDKYDYRKNTRYWQSLTRIHPSSLEMDPILRLKLKKKYKTSINELEKILNITIDEWR